MKNYCEKFVSATINIGDFFIENNDQIIKCLSKLDIILNQLKLHVDRCDKCIKD